MDIALIQTEGGFDIDLSGPDVKQDRGLRTAIIISLFTDRQAEPDDNIPDGSENRRGWWADVFMGPDGSKIGSRLWLLSREKQTRDVLGRAVAYARESLQWLVVDGVARWIDVSAEWLRPGVLALYVQVYKHDGGVFDEMFERSFLEI